MTFNVLQGGEYVLYQRKSLEESLIDNFKWEKMVLLDSRYSYQTNMRLLRRQCIDSPRPRTTDPNWCFGYGDNTPAEAGDPGFQGRNILSPPPHSDLVSETSVGGVFK